MEQEIILDEEFRFLLPELDAKTYKSLEESIVKHGCMYPLVVWGGVLVDGYNRYRICTEHGISFETVEKDFSSREDALIWIIDNQVSRRNLSPIQLSYYRGLHYQTDKKKVGNSSGRNQHSNEEFPQNGVIPKSQATATRLAGQYKVSRNTIERDAKLSAAIDAIGQSSPEAKRKLLSGELKLDKKALAELASMDKGEIQGIAAKIENGAYEKQAAPVDPAPDSSMALDTAPTERERLINFMLADISPLNAADEISTEFHAKLSNANTAERAELKTTLRAYIDLLETLYAQI